MTGYLELNYRARETVAYSICASQPGWNVKYKKSGKALCTLYPEKDYFIALIVLGKKDREAFEKVSKEFGDYINNLYENCSLFNGTKWLMIEVTDRNVLDDVKKLIQLKVN